jgi:transcriptional regulator with XRE-family HTH domain
MLLGLSQEDINAAAGLADGHINKLEAFHRTAQFPTLQLWANTIGLSITVAPAILPPATTRAIERRPAPLRTSSTQMALFND